MRLILMVLMLAACSTIDYTQDPWELGATAPAPVGCEEWRDRDPEADC